MARPYDAERRVLILTAELVLAGDGYTPMDRVVLLRQQLRDAVDALKENPLNPTIPPSDPRLSPGYKPANPNREVSP